MKTIRSVCFLPLLTATLLFGIALASSVTRAENTPETAAASAQVADLSGKFTDFKIKPAASGMLKVAGTLTITNAGPATAKNVNVKFYVSTDTEVDPEDLVYTFPLSEYNAGSSKLKSGSQVQLALKQKVVSLIGSLLDGQYLLIELTADNNTPTPAANHNVIAVGPIVIPK